MWPTRVDHHHDREPEAEGDAEVAELPGLRVDHDRAATREDERERADQLGRQRADEVRHQQQPALGAGWITGRPLDSGVLVFTAFTIAPCMPSATWWVKVTLTSSKPAASRPASYSPFESAPAMQPT